MKRLTTAVVAALVLVVLFLLPVVLIPLAAGGGRDGHTPADRVSEICEAGEAGLARIPEKYREDIANAAKTSGFSQEVLAAQIEAESGWNERAVSSSNAKGLAQFKDVAWETYGAGGDPFNGHDAIAAQGRFLGDLRQQFKQYADDDRELTELALAGYTIGASHVHKVQGFPDYSNQAVNYVEKILGKGVQVYTTNCASVHEPILGDIEISPEGWTHPLPGGRFTSAFGWRDCSTWQRVECTPEVANHSGIDLSTGGDGTVVAATKMKITWVVEDNALGNPVNGRQVDDPGLVFGYWHCAPNSHRVKVGDVVEAGDPICTEGETGNALGKHLHFMISTPQAPDDRHSRKYIVDPAPVLTQQGVELCPPGAPVTGPCSH